MEERGKKVMSCTTVVLQNQSDLQQSHKEGEKMERKKKKKMSDTGVKK